MILGIIGPSCSGKSTLAQKLAQEYTGFTLSSDKFYKRGLPKVYVQHHGEMIRSFERPELYDGEAVAKIIKNYKEQGEVTFSSYKSFTEKVLEEYHIKKPTRVFVEGFQLLCYPQLEQAIDVSIYLDIPFAEQVRRRQARGGRKSDENFIKIGKGEYETYILPQKEKADYVLDGIKSSEELFKEIKDIYQNELLHETSS